MTEFPGKLLSILSGRATVTIVGAMLWYSRYGIDFTDEGFALSWISDPFLYTTSTTQFGFIYHPLFELLGANIAHLRQANVLITFGLAWSLSDILLKKTLSQDHTHRWKRLTAAAAFASASLIIFDTWMLTPSYNSLTLQAMLVVAIGMLLAGNEVSTASLAGWVLIGVGGWLAFMAKPTTSIVLCVVVIAYVVIARTFRFRLAAISAASALGLLLVSASAIDGSITGFISRLKTGTDLLGVLGGGHTFAGSIRLDTFHFGSRNLTIMLLVAATLFFSGHVIFARSRSIAAFAAAVAVLLALVTIVILHGHARAVFGTNLFRALLMWSVPLGAVLLGISAIRLKGIRKIPISRWVLMVGLLTLPYAYAFGTNMNYWRVGGSAALFWVLAGLVLLSSIRRTPAVLTVLLGFGIATQVLTAGLLAAGAQTPYRQPQPLNQNDTTATIGRVGSTLVLSKGYADYVSAAISSADKAGFKTGNPIIDLTGKSPSLLYALGAKSIGQAWLLGSYPGSNQLAAESLKLVPCGQLASSWLLVETGGPRALSNDVLTSFRADFAKDYVVVGEWDTAKGAGGYATSKRQQLLKPTRQYSTANAACQSAREGPR